MSSKVVPASFQTYVNKRNFSSELVAHVVRQTYILINKTSRRSRTLSLDVKLTEAGQYRRYAGTVWTYYSDDYLQSCVIQPRSVPFPHSPTSHAMRDSRSLPATTARVFPLVGHLPPSLNWLQFCVTKNLQLLRERIDCATARTDNFWDQLFGVPELVSEICRPERWM